MSSLTQKRALSCLLRHWEVVSFGKPTLTSIFFDLPLEHQHDEPHCKCAVHSSANFLVHSCPPFRCIGFLQSLVVCGKVGFITFLAFSHSSTGRCLKQCWIIVLNWNSAVISHTRSSIRLKSASRQLGHIDGMGTSNECMLPNQSQSLGTMLAL